MKKRQKKLIINYLKKNSYIKDWYGEHLSKEDIVKIVSTQDGLLKYENDLFDYNIDFIWDTEREIINNAIAEFDLDIDPEDFREEFLEYITIDLNVEKLLKNTDITVLLKVYSNYDCATSHQDIDDPDDYLGDVYQRFKYVVNKKEFLAEFLNSYTASLLCFAWKMSIWDYLELKKSFTSVINLPEGLQYGFFSSFNGSGSMFDARLISPISVVKDITEYDGVDLIIDVEQGYGLIDVYGCDDFIDKNNVTAK